MRDSLIGDAVSGVAGVVTSAADTVTDTSTTSPPASTTSTPTSTTSTPATTTATPATTTATPTTTTPTPATTAATPTATATTAVSADSSTTATATATPGIDSGSASSTTETTQAPASATATANASATVVVTVNSTDSGSTQLRDDSSASQSLGYNQGGLSTGSIVGIVIGSLAAVFLIAALFLWYRRRKKYSSKRRSLSFDASYAVAPASLPAANAVALESLNTSSRVVVHNMNFDHTMNLDSSSASASHEKPQSALWEDAAITAARIPMEKLTRRNIINSGGHGEVYRGLYRGESVAIKMLLPEKRKDLNQINIFLAEIKIMASVEHPRIVRFIGVAWDSLTDLCAVSEFMEGGDLFSLLRRFERVEHRSPGFDVDKARIALHVAHSLTYLHSLDPVILHRDLKSMNILLTSDLEAKITDFGVSRKWTVDTMTAGVGTRLWMAPEVMLGKRYDTSADIFSFGIVLSELDSHLPPYANVRDVEGGGKLGDTALLELVAAGLLRVEFSANAPKALVNLGHACVDMDPKARPTAGEVHYQLQRILRRYQKYTI